MEPARQFEVCCMAFFVALPEQIIYEMIRNQNIPQPNIYTTKIETNGFQNLATTMGCNIELSHDE